MDKTCHIMHEGEILNASQTKAPLLDALIYGDKVLSAKLSKRVSCAIKHLPLRVAFSFQYNTQKAIEKGITKDPTLCIDGEIFVEGLIATEEIVARFERLLKRQN